MRECFIEDGTLLATLLGSVIRSSCTKRIVGETSSIGFCLRVQCSFLPGSRKSTVGVSVAELTVRHLFAK